MKLAFLGIFLILGLGLSYVLWHIWQILPISPAWKTALVVLLVMVFSCFFVGMSGSLDKMPLTLAQMVYQMGTGSLIALLYLFLLFLLLDLGKWTHLISYDFLHGSLMGTLTVLLSITALLVAGNLHYHHKVPVEKKLITEKPLHGPIKAILISDLHLGYHNTRKDLARWVNLLNDQHPDLILIAGDIIDISARPLQEEQMAQEFLRLKAPVYACMGNHEYYSGSANALRFFSQAGIRLLRDSGVVFNNCLNLIGRDDRTNPARKDLATLVAQTDSTLFTLLLDHQPYHLEEAEQAGIDFQFSGHTHNAQVWPANLLIKALYENGYGFSTKGRTNYYVSSGFGIWGGKFRIGTNSEFLLLTIANK